MHFVIIILTAAIAVAQAEANLVCPQIVSTDPCILGEKDECGCDSQCPPQKCCSSGCGGVCMDAVSVCPSVRDSLGLCVDQTDECSRDADCARLKCCHTGCGQSCVRPVCKAVPCKESPCPYEFMRDKYGCDIDPCKGFACNWDEECRLITVVCETSDCMPVPANAECVAIPSCSPYISCTLFCQHGYARNEAGCAICQCYQPCQTVECAEGCKCEVIPCHGLWCLPTAHCV